MIRLLAPLAIVSLGLAAEQAGSQETGAFAQAPLASVEQPQYFLPQQFQGAQSQQFVQYQPQQQQFYYPQQQTSVQVQAQPQQFFNYPYQQVQYAPVAPAFEMSPKLTIPTGLLRKHIKSSSDEPSVFAMSYNPETGVKVATINGKKVFAYKQRFPGAPKEDVEIVENGEINTSGNPVVVASTTENEAGEKTKNVWFDDKEDPMVKIEKEPVAAVATTTVDPNLPVVNQDGDETTTAASVATTTVAATVPAAGVTVTPVPVVSGAEAVATTTVAAVPAAAVVVPTTTTAAPVASTTTPAGPSEAFFAAQNPMYMANVAAFAARYPQYFPTRFAAKQLFPAAQQSQQFAAFPTTVAPAAGFQVGSGLSQVHPVYAQSAISTTTPFPQVAPQYLARPVAVGVPRPVYLPVPQQTVAPQVQPQFLQSTAVTVAAAQQQFLSTPVPQQYLHPVQQQAQVVPQQYLQPSNPQPVPQQYLQPVQQQAQVVPQQYLQPVQQQTQPQFAQQQPTQQYLQPTTPQSVYQQPTAQPQPTQQPQYIPQQHQQYQQPRYPAPAAPRQHQYTAPPPPTPAYHNVQRPAPPQDFTEDELKPTEPVHAQHQGATSTMPPGMSPDDRYHAPTQYQQSNGYTTPEPAYERPSPPPRYRPAPAPSRYVERPAENERSEPTSTPGYDVPETTTYAPRPAPSRRPYYPQRPTSSYSRPAYRQPYRRPQPAQRPRYNPAPAYRPAPARYNPNRKVTYYRAGTSQRAQQQQTYARPSNSYSAPPDVAATTQSPISDYVPSPSYRQHNNGYSRPQQQYSAAPAREEPTYASSASQTAYRGQSQYSNQPAQVAAQPQYAAQRGYTTTEEPAPGERYYARVNNDDQSKVKYSESPFDNMEFLSTPFPAGQKKDVKVTFINRHRTA